MKNPQPSCTRTESPNNTLCIYLNITYGWNWAKNWTLKGVSIKLFSHSDTWWRSTCSGEQVLGTCVRRQGSIQFVHYSHFSISLLPWNTKLMKERKKQGRAIEIFRCETFCSFVLNRDIFLSVSSITWDTIQERNLAVLILSSDITDPCIRTHLLHC